MAKALALVLIERMASTYYELNMISVQPFIENLDWLACIKRYDRPHTLFYLDPPYWDTAGYGNEFGLGEYRKMADLARSIKGNMIISVNDCSKMREVFKGLKMKAVPITYTVGRVQGRSPKKELITPSCAAAGNETKDIKL